MTQFRTPSGGIGGFLTRLLSGLAGGVQQGLAQSQQQKRQDELLDRRRREQVVDMATRAGVPLQTILNPDEEGPGPTAIDPLTGHVLQGIETKRELGPATTEDLLSRIGLVNKEQSLFQNTLSQERLDTASTRAEGIETPEEKRQRQIDLIRIRAEEGVETARQVTKIKTSAAIKLRAAGEIPTTKVLDNGVFRDMTDEELGISIFDERLREQTKEEERQLELLNNKNIQAFDLLSERFRLQGQQIEAKAEVAKQQALFLKGLKTDKGINRKWGNVTNASKQKILAAADVMQIVNRIEAQAGVMNAAIGAFSSRIDSFGGFFGTEGGAYARALIAELKTAIFSRGGKAWTKIEVASMQPLVPKVGNIFSANDSETQVQSKLRNIRESLHDIVRNALMFELSEGKTFNTSVVEDFGFNSKILGLPEVDIRELPFDISIDDLREAERLRLEGR